MLDSPVTNNEYMYVRAAAENLSFRTATNTVRTRRFCDLQMSRLTYLLTYLLSSSECY